MEGGFLPWKLKKDDGVKYADYRNLREPLPKPPKGYHWTQEIDAEGKTWGLQDEATGEVLSSLPVEDDKKAAGGKSVRCKLLGWRWTPWTSCRLSHHLIRVLGVTAPNNSALAQGMVMVEGAQVAANGTVVATASEAMAEAVGEPAELADFLDHVIMPEDTLAGICLRCEEPRLPEASPLSPRRHASDPRALVSSLEPTRSAAVNVFGCTLMIPAAALRACPCPQVPRQSASAAARERLPRGSDAHAQGAQDPDRPPLRQRRRIRAPVSHQGTIPPAVAMVLLPRRAFLFLTTCWCDCHPPNRAQTAGRGGAGVPEHYDAGRGRGKAVPRGPRLGRAESPGRLARRQRVGEQGLGRGGRGGGELGGQGGRGRGGRGGGRPQGVWSEGGRHRAAALSAHTARPGDASHLIRTWVLRCPCKNYFYRFTAVKSSRGPCVHGGALPWCNQACLLCLFSRNMKINRVLGVCG